MKVFTWLVSLMVSVLSTKQSFSVFLIVVPALHLCSELFVNLTTHYRGCIEYQCNPYLSHFLVCHYRALVSGLPLMSFYCTLGVSPTLPSFSDHSVFARGSLPMAAVHGHLEQILNRVSLRTLL